MCKLKPLLTTWLSDTEKALIDGTLEMKLTSEPPAVMMLESTEGGSQTSTIKIVGKRRKKRTNIEGNIRTSLERLFDKNPKPTVEEKEPQCSAGMMPNFSEHSPVKRPPSLDNQLGEMVTVEIMPQKLLCIRDEGDSNGSSEDMPPARMMHNTLRRMMKNKAGFWRRTCSPLNLIHCARPKKNKTVMTEFRPVF